MKLLVIDDPGFYIGSDNMSPVNVSQKRLHRRRIRSAADCSWRTEAARAVSAKAAVSAPGVENCHRFREIH